MCAFFRFNRHKRRGNPYFINGDLSFDGANDIILTLGTQIESSCFSVIAVCDIENREIPRISVLNTAKKTSPYNGLDCYLFEDGYLGTYEYDNYQSTNVQAPADGRFTAYWEQNTGVSGSFKVAVDDSNLETIFTGPINTALLGLTDEMRLGGNGNDRTLFIGKQYMVALFNRPLTADERQHIYNNGKCNKLPKNLDGLISIWILGLTCPETGFCPDLYGTNHGTAQNFNLASAINPDEGYIKQFGSKKINLISDPSITYMLPNKVNKQANTLPNGWAFD